MDLVWVSFGFLLDLSWILCWINVGSQMDLYWISLGSSCDVYWISIGSLLDPTSIVYAFLLPFCHNLVNIVNFTRCFLKVPSIMYAFLHVEDGVGPKRVSLPGSR